MYLNHVVSRFNVYNQTHSCIDVTDVNGNTPLDLALENSSDVFYDEDDDEDERLRERFTEIVDYLKSFPTEHSELLLFLSNVCTDLLYVQ